MRLKMKKRILLSLLTLCSVSLFGQDVIYKISGVVNDKPKAKYAHLISFYKNVTKVPVINGRFEFNLKRDRELDMRALVLSEDSLITYDAFMQQKRSQADDSRTILIENMEISSGYFVSNAIVKGTQLNKDLEDMFETIKSGAYELYFSNHRDSPVSVLFLKSLAQINTFSSRLTTYNCELYFEMLSDRIKNSPEGKALAEKMKKI